MHKKWQIESTLEENCQHFPGRVVPAQHKERDGIPRLRVIHSCKEQSVKTEELTQESKSGKNVKLSTAGMCNATQGHNVENFNDSHIQTASYEHEPDGVSEPSTSGGVMHNVKQKLSGNMGNYSNLFQGMAYLFRLSSREKKSGRSRSGSRNRNSDSRKSTSNRSSVIINEREILEDNFVNIENIELYHMDGFVYSSEKEKGKGHNFVPIHLKAPTWCDKCG